VRHSAQATASTLALSLLTACGGGGDQTVIINPPSFAANQAAVDALFVVETDVRTTIAPLAANQRADLPTSGTASFEGVAIAGAGTGTPGVDAVTTLLYYGDAEYTINFSAATISGTGNDFKIVTNPTEEGSANFSPTVGGNVAGSLTISGQLVPNITGGVFDTSANPFTVSGALTGSDGTSITYNGLQGTAPTYGAGVEDMRLIASDTISSNGQTSFIGFQSYVQKQEP